jgi:ADP-L-glycero-D-manno-heptose 6-epimerase
MGSVVLHAFRQIKEKREMKLFRSHKEGVKDGEQQRDFVYVKDVVDVLFWLMHHRNREFSGIYNLGSGKAETFLHLAESVFAALGKEKNIAFIDTPEDIRDKYQYYTEAKMEKLRSIGYEKPFHSLEEGVKDYVQNYLAVGAYL